MANKFTIPATTYLGAGALKSAESDICSLGKKAFIVAGRSMISQGHIKKLTEILSKNGIGHSIYSEITGEPTDTMIDNGLLQYNEEDCDFIIGFGGGSPLDSAKAIGAMVTNEGKISDYNGKVLVKAIPPLVAIPSTAGTGSEATQFTIISDTKKNIKMLLKGLVLIPTIAIVDSTFTMNAPKNVTSATGLDALTHAIEAYTSKKSFGESDLFALSAIKRIFEYLPIAYKDGSNTKAREEMSLASYEAGVSINNSSVTLVHGMSRPIGALFHVPHGLSNAMLLKICMNFAVKGAVERFAILGRAIGVADVNDTDEIAVNNFLKAIEDICRICEVPTLEEYGIDKNEFFDKIDKMSKDAYDSGSPSNTRQMTTVDDMKEMYLKLWK